MNCKVINAILINIGLTVALAKDGQQALNMITGGDSADLIFMDLHMPVMDGYIATKQIRRWETENGQPRRPIIALTSDAFDEDRQNCLDTGMDDFLSKPVMIGPLKQILSKWLKTESVTMPSIIESIAKKSVDVPRA